MLRRLTVVVTTVLLLAAAMARANGSLSGISQEGQKVLQLVEAAGGKGGTVRFSLGWNNQNDLDLHCIGPDGVEISFKNRRSKSGGELDVDMNAKAPLVTSPVENIRWLEGSAPTGKYRVFVQFFNLNGGPDPTPFRVICQVGQQVREVTGSVPSSDEGPRPRPIFEVGTFEFDPAPRQIEVAAPPEGWILPLLVAALLAVATLIALLFGNDAVRSGVLMALAGGLAFFLAEPIQIARVAHPIALLVKEVAYFSVVGGVLACCLGGLDGISVGSFRKAVHDSVWSLGAGTLGGTLGGALGQVVFSTLAGGPGSGLIAVVLARSIGWGIAGAFVGSGPGLVGRSAARALKGVAGGVIGGVIGGIAFCLLGNLFGPRLARMVSLAILGAAIGFFIRAVEAITKRAWVTLIKGFPEGKQWPLDKDAVTVGANELSDILLLRDPQIRSQHAVIRRSGRGYSIEGIEGSVLINGRDTGKAELNDGDRIDLGTRTLLVHIEGATASAPAPEHAPVAAPPARAPFPAGTLARLVPQDGKPAVYLVNPEHVLGSRVDSLVPLTGPGIDSTHTLLKQIRGEWFLFDKSIAGQSVNGVKVVGRVKLENGAVLDLGPVRFVFELP